MITLPLLSHYSPITLPLLSPLLSIPNSWNQAILRELSPNNTQWEKIRMRIRKETRWILLNPLHHKSGPSILSIRAIHSCGKGTCQAANADSLLVIANWVGECETRRPGSTTCCFMDMRCSPGR